MLPVPLKRVINKTVADLGPGQSGRVARVAGADAMAVRLLEMGFVPDVAVAVRKLAPLGDPMELRLRGYHVSVRKEEARRIVLRPTGSPADEGDGA